MMLLKNTEARVLDNTKTGLNLVLNAQWKAKEYQSWKNSECHVKGPFSMGNERKNITIHAHISFPLYQIRGFNIPKQHRDAAVEGLILISPTCGFVPCN